jgi:hypothetical protein
LILKTLKNKKYPVKRYRKKIGSNKIPFKSLIVKDKTPSTSSLFHALTRDWNKGKARLVSTIAPEVINYSIE